MDDCPIRLLTPDDLEGAMRLSSTAGWNQRLEDWGMLVSLAPAASFAAFSQQRVVATAIGIDYGRFSWIAMMLVDPAWRGRGLGRRLLEAAMAALPADRPIRLDATPLGRPLYQSCGFEDEALLTRHVAGSVQRAAPPEPRGAQTAVQAMTLARLGAVADEDRRVFGGNRRAVLEWSFDTAREYCHTVEASTGSTQYCLGRRGRLFDQIGPVVAEHTAAACTLVSAALAPAFGRPAVIDSYDEQTGFSSWLRECGFQAERPLFRMRRAPDRDATGSNEGPARAALAEFAIFGPEFA